MVCLNPVGHGSTTSSDGRKRSRCYLFILKILRIACYAGAIFFGLVTISLIADGDVAGAILSAIITAIPAAAAWMTGRRLKKINDAKEEERRWKTPESFVLVVIAENEDDEDPQIEDVANRLFEMENLGAMHEYSIDEVRKALPMFYVSRYPTYLIVNDSWNEELGEMLSNVRVQGEDAEPLLQFLKEELWEHEMKLRKGNEGTE